MLRGIIVAFLYLRSRATITSLVTVESSTYQETNKQHKCGFYRHWWPVTLLLLPNIIKIQILCTVKL